MSSSLENEDASILRSWTLTTTQQLQDSTSTAFDVLDHVLDDSAGTLVKELTPFLSQLKPARTRGDVQAAEILALLPQSMVDTTPTTSRGDNSFFIGRDQRHEPNFRETHPTLSKLIASIEATVEKHLSHCIELDTSLTSVQLAVYPGNGVSGYPKHCDRSKNVTEKGMQRIVTCVYYLTPQDWNADLDGGYLRVFATSDEQQFSDVVPYSNRMVVFRSDVVEHQVMPSKRRERMALAIWLYGKEKENVTVALPRRTLPSMQPSNANNNATTPDATMTSAPPLDVSNTAAENDTKTIFVSIAAYRDSELGPTLRSLATTAQYPDRVFCGVVLQLDSTADQNILSSLPTEMPWFQHNVKILQLDARHARGPCYARDLCQRLYDGEDFVLQTDSHMRFRQNWDSYLIQELTKCPSPKPMLTTYPDGYTLPNNVPDETRATLLVPWKFDQEGMLRQRGRLLQPRDTSVRCYLYAAGFNFAHSSVLEDVPYDHTLQHLFFGEEVSMAVRLFTHGYDLFAPPESVCFHLWSRSHRPTPLQDTTSPQQKRRQDEQRNAARKVVLQQLRGEGRGLGTERSVQEFAQAIGVDFDAHTISAEAQLGGLEVAEFAMDASTLAPDSLEGQVASLDTKTQAKIFSFLSAMNS